MKVFVVSISGKPDAAFVQQSDAINFEREHAEAETSIEPVTVYGIDSLTDERSSPGASSVSGRFSGRFG